MDREKLAEWMKQEHVRIQELSNHLREHVVAVPPGSREAWLAELNKRFDHFAAHVRRVMSIQEEGGYLLPVLEVRPTLSAQVELLRHEHTELRQLMDNLQETVRALKPQSNLLIRDACTRIQVFLGHVQRHEEHENHIVLYTLTEDIGVTS